MNVKFIRIFFTFSLVVPIKLKNIFIMSLTRAFINSQGTHNCQLIITFSIHAFTGASLCSMREYGRASVVDGLVLHLGAFLVENLRTEALISFFSASMSGSFLSSRIILGTNKHTRKAQHVTKMTIVRRKARR